MGAINPCCTNRNVCIYLGIVLVYAHPGRLESVDYSLS
jgi:hypothetical protein